MNNKAIFDNKALNQIKKLVGGGGTIKVDELPETGEEYTIYELSQELPGGYNWVTLPTTFKRCSGMSDGTPMVLEEEPSDWHIFDQLSPFYHYIKSEDKIFIKIRIQTEGDDEIKYEEIERYENYPQNVFILEDRIIIIVKDYNLELNIVDGNYIFSGTLTLLNDTVVDLSSFDSELNIIAFKLQDITSPIFVTDSSNYNLVKLESSEQLPTAEDLVRDELVDYNGVTISRYSVGNNVYYNYPQSDEKGYAWSTNYYQFYNTSEGESSKYTGELEWDGEYCKVKNEYIPIRDSFIFKPILPHIETSHWIYIDNNWINIDEIPQNIPSEMVFGILTKKEEQEYLTILNSSLSYQEIMDYCRGEEKTVILQYTKKDKEGSEYNFYYAIEYADFYDDDNHYSFEGETFKQSTRISGFIEWDFDNQTFKYNDGSM